MRILLLALLAFAGLPIQAQELMKCPTGEGSPLWYIATCEISGNAHQGEAYHNPEGLSIWDASQFDNITFIDWKLETDEVLASFNFMMKATGIPQLSEPVYSRLLQRGKDSWGASVPMEELSKPLEEEINKRGKCLLYIDTGSDSYGFAVVDAYIYHRWLWVRVDESLGFSPASDDVQFLGYSSRNSWSDSPLDEDTAHQRAAQFGC